MSISKVLGVVATVLLAASTAGAATRCNLNPGGPEELVLTVPQSGSDFDAGWTGDVHNYDVPGGARFRLCLANCDNDTDPLCDVQGQADQLSAAGRTFAPPIPVVIGTTAVCIQANFADPAVSGTVNLETGLMAATANLAANVYLTTLTNVCPQCVAGTCNGGANSGAACTIGETVNVQGAIDTTYDVSIDCPASGTAIPVALTVNVTTGQSSASNCPGQTDSNDCAGAQTCTAVCTGGNHGGITQSCCSGATTKACFPATVTRQGSSAPPLPVWPNPSYPKTETTAAATLVSAFCAPGAPGILGIAVNQDVGLPGPAAFILPLNQELIGDTDGDGLPDTLDGCTNDADCDDDGVIDGSIDGGEDSNNDGVVDAGETDPTDQDSDNDGLPDGLERGLTAPQRPADFGGTFVADADPATTTDGANPDTDGDGLLDGDEDADHNGRVDAGETDPNVPDGTTTTTSSTTSTTVAGGCSSATECNDDDPCTDDSCPADACVFTQKTGAEGAQCELDDVQDGPICGTDPLDAKTDKAVAAALAKVDGFLAKIATASPAKKKKFIKKAKAALKVVQTKAGKAGKKGKISTDCAATITEKMAELSAIVGAL
ncbi:MAG TPA: hypothetical protein VGR62_24935 [Candidatus Binatia bacterium]|nr:hypothetical protein [Candidatus Binatia bacterium]